MTAVNDYFGRSIAFNLMFKPVGAVCNLACKYCYYLEKQKLYGKSSNFRMPDKLLEEAIKQYIESQTVQNISFVWQGGEPTLLGINFFRKIIEFQEKYRGDKNISNSFQTNGTTLNKEWCEFFRENNFLLGISIDGTQHIHDRYRPTRKGEGTFHKVMEGINLLKRHRVEFNTLSVVNDYNAKYPIEVYRFLKDIGSGFMQFIPIVERLAEDPGDEGLERVSPDFSGNAAVADWSVGKADYGKFLIKIFDEWVKYDVGKFFVQIFDTTLANHVESAPGLCVFAETCGNASVIEHNGDVYSCDHFVYGENLIGNIKETHLRDMMLSAKQIKFGFNKKNKLPKQCNSCEYLFACRGGCPKNRISITEDKEKGLNYLCPSYKAFFAHVKPYMEFMSEELKNERPPSNVMNWIKQKNLTKKIEIKNMKKTTKNKKFSNVKRNDPCPCGSGKLFKNCCRNRR